LVLAVSIALYIVVQFFPLNLPNYPGGTGWFFNPFAWQLLFVIGLVSGTSGSRGWRIGPLVRRMLLMASAAIVIAAFIVAAPWRQVPGLEHVVLVPWSWLPPLSKTDLSFLRLLDILALFFLVGSAMHSDSRLLQHTVGRLFALLGRHSLPVFAIGIIGALLGNVIFMEIGRGLVPHVFVNTAGFLAMLSVAWVASWLKSEPWNIAKEGGTSGLAITGSLGNDLRRPSMRLKRPVTLLLCATLPAAVNPRLAAGDDKCPAPTEYVRFAATFPNAKASIAERGVLDIVAFGSSATQGAGGSKPETDYPTRLQEELSARLPDVKVRVSNRGIGGQTVRDMLERMQTDVLDEEPSLTIWQTGINDALQDVPIEQFKEILRYAIEIMQDNNIDVVLMDIQYYAASERVPDYGEYLDALREVAAEKSIPLFRQNDIMKQTISQSSDIEKVFSADYFHAGDLNYGCLAIELAHALQSAVR
jgi:lysophospholipase L1-like esterase